VLTDPENVAWSAAAELYRGQVDFLYVDARAVESGTVRDGALRIGAHAFCVVVRDGTNLLSAPVRSRLDLLVAQGGLFLDAWAPGSVAGRVRAHHEPDLLWSGDACLRHLHVERSGLDLYFLVNEGESRIRGELGIRGEGSLWLWDPWEPSRHGIVSEARDGRTVTPIGLERRESLLLVRDRRNAGEPGLPARALPGRALAHSPISWRVSGPAGIALDLPPLRDWAHLEGWETFTGTVGYRGELDLDAAQAVSAAFLDLGGVGEIAEVAVNGRALGICAWAPYVLPCPGAFRLGNNAIEVRVSNSMANAYDGLQLPSGLVGPATLRLAL
jgi:hypothetical protein